MNEQLNNLATDLAGFNKHIQARAPTAQDVRIIDALLSGIEELDAQTGDAYKYLTAAHASLVEDVKNEREQLSKNTSDNLLDAERELLQATQD